MKKFRTLRWTALVTLAIFSCSSEDKDPAPSADFASTIDAEDFRKVTFENKSANATEFEWDFGDDSDISTEANPVHIFPEPGEYTVVLTAINGGSEITKERKVTITAKLTSTVLNGGSAKAWKLKPAGGSFIVGPSIGSGEWYPGVDGNGNPKDLSAERPCLFNDEFIFKTGGGFEYDANGDIWAEGYMGYSDGDKDKCQDETTMPLNAAAWKSGNHTYAFASGSPAKITVTGTGAFIVLPKAKNGGEYSAAPPTADASVVYDVVSYNIADGVETLVITINFGPGFWTYTLIHEIE
jgi:PKD repeat protein